MVQSRTGTSVGYRIYKNLDEMYYAHTSLHAVKRTFSEIIMEGPQKFRLDIDIHIRDSSDMTTLVRTVTKVLKGIIPWWIPRVLVYNIVSSHHIIIPGLFMESSGCCHMVATIIQHKLHRKLPYVANAIDMGVYKGIQAFRLEGSTKHMQYRWKYLVDTQEISALEKFKDGIIGYTVGCKQVDTDDIVTYAVNISRVYSPVVDEEDTFPGERHTAMDMGAFTVRKRIGDMTILNRIRPSYCSRCMRTHDNENAYIIGNRIYCRRSGG